LEQVDIGTLHLSMTTYYQHSLLQSMPLFGCAALSIMGMLLVIDKERLTIPRVFKTALTLSKALTRL